MQASFEIWKSFDEQIILVQPIIECLFVVCLIYTKRENF